MLHFIKHTYKLYITLLFRFLIDLGIKYTLITALIASVGIAILFTAEKVILAALINFVIVALVFTTRKDKSFLALQYKYANAIIAIDCLLLSTPIFIRLITEGKVLYLATYIVAVCILFLLAPYTDNTSLLNIPLKNISQHNLMVKSSIRRYAAILIGLVTILYASVLFNTKNNIQVYIYQLLLFFVCLLPSEAENAWHIKMFRSPKTMLLLKGKDLSITYSIISFGCIVPFITSNSLLPYFIISISGLLSIHINNITATLFASNKLLTIITQIISVGFIFISFKLPQIIVLQLIMAIALIYFTHNALKKRYQW